MTPRVWYCLLCSLVFVITTATPALADEDSSTSIRFTDLLVSDDYNYAYGVTASDLDGDDDLDLTTQDIRGIPSLSTLYWHENDGDGMFQRHPIYRREPGWLERHNVADINLDGKLDVAVIDNRDGEILWFANGMQPGKPGPWKRHVLSSKCPYAYDVVFCDVDGDNDPDAISSGYLSSTFAWYENPGPSQQQHEWKRFVIDNKMPEARTVRPSDFNQDGRIDFLGASVGIGNVAPEIADWSKHGGSIAWYENTGDAATRWRKHVIDDVGRAPIHGEPADMDRDGDLDVVIATGMRDDLLPRELHAVVWYERLTQANGSFLWLRHRIGLLPYAHDAVAADFDGDGDVDVAASSWAKGNRVVWFENTGGPREGWTEHLLRNNWPAANQILVADLNGDGRPDIISSADDGSRRADGAREVRWWRNEGQ